MTRIGGFVIHGNSAPMLRACLESLKASCSEVVAIDSESNDGSREICASCGVRSVVFPWRGYGAARAEGVRQLSNVDYIFFLDSDEWLERSAIQTLLAWREQKQDLPHYTLQRNDWAVRTDGSGRYLFRSETRVRLIRADCATWTDEMIVHEAMPKGRQTRATGAALEHAFADSVETLRSKQLAYALLWAVLANARGEVPKTVRGRALGAAFRNAVVKGALFRGGADGWRLSRAVGEYHENKHRYLEEIQAGGWKEATQLYASGAYSELFDWVKRNVAPPKRY